MRNFYLNLLLLLILNTQSVYSQRSNNSCTITYIANEGFLIETANHKILIDALFGGIQGTWCDQPGDSISNLMLKGSPPFNNIDLILVTHKHVDHFTAPMVTTFLINNKKSILICPEQVNEKLKSQPDYAKVSHRIISLSSSKPFDSLLSVNNINVRVLRFNHGSYFETDSAGNKYDIHSEVENFDYIIDCDGFSIFHSGDGSFLDKSYFEYYNISKKEFDLVFLNRTFLNKEGQEIMNSVIHTKNLIFMHIEPGKYEFYRSIVKNVPEIFIFKTSMEKKTITK